MSKRNPIRERKGRKIKERKRQKKCIRKKIVGVKEKTDKRKKRRYLGSRNKKKSINKKTCKKNCVKEKLDINEERRKEGSEEGQRRGIKTKKMYQSYFLRCLSGRWKFGGVGTERSLWSLGGGKDHVTIFLLRKAEGVTKVAEDERTWRKK